MNNEINKAYAEMLSNKSYLSMSSREIARKLHVSIDAIKEARERLKSEGVNVYIPKVLFLNFEFNNESSTKLLKYFTYRWLNTEKVIEKNEELEPTSDYDILKKLWYLVSQSELIIWYSSNSTTFDIYKKFASYNMPSLKPLKTVYFDCHNKCNCGCNNSDYNETNSCFDEACSMYSNNDYLYSTYMKDRAFANNHPNFALIFEEDLCPTCCSDDYEVLYGEYYYTDRDKYQLYRCNNCGRVFADKNPIRTNVNNVNI